MNRRERDLLCMEDQDIERAAHPADTSEGLTERPPGRGEVDAYLLARRWRYSSAIQAAQAAGRYPIIDPV